MKYHRNVYYSHIPNGEDLKPISAIIGTLVAKIAETQLPSIDTFSLLEEVLSQLNVYSEQLTENATNFRYRHPGMTLFTRKDKEWVLKNPANPEDNLTDSWKNNDLIAKTFFNWIKSAHNNFILSLGLTDKEFRNKIEQALGENVVKKSWGDRYCPSVSIPITNTTHSKPWRTK